MANEPSRLERDPIIECIFEVRFAAGNASTAELMPGMLFGKLRHLFTASQVLPFYQVPAVVREQDVNLRFQPTHVLEGNGVRLLIGSRVLAVSFTKPYLGWQKTAPLIVQCVRAALDTGLPGAAERCAIKYVNLIPDSASQYLRNLKLTLDLAGLALTSEGITIRAETNLNGCANVIEIASKAKLQMQPTSTTVPMALEGMYVAVDTVKNGPFNALATELPQLLEEIHATEKQVFFSLLTKETLESMGPVYATAH